MSTHNMFSWRNKKTINTFGLKLEFRESDLFPQCFKLQLSDMKKERERKKYRAVRGSDNNPDAALLELPSFHSS